MSTAESPTRDVVFIPESHSNSSGSSSTTESNHDYHLSKKPRNYKYWSDEEVKKILNWFNLPENEGKLARNKAQACREVAKTLFDGDEYMAISVRSKLMSLEKSFREAEQLRKRLSMNSKDESIINDKMKEINKFHKECKQLFSNRTEDPSPPPSRFSSLVTANHLPPHISTSPISRSPPSSSSSSTINTTTSYSLQNPGITQAVSFPQNNNNNLSSSSLIATTPKKPSLLSRHDCDSPPSSSSSSFLSNNDTNNNSNNSKNNSNTTFDEPVLPHLNENYLRRLSFPSHVSKDSSWSLSRAAPITSKDQQQQQQQQQHQHHHRHSSNQNSPTTPTTRPSSSEISSVKIARYAAKQASYSARKAEYEALKSEYEGQKMEYSIRLAEIERERDSLAIKKLELELELEKTKKKQV